VYPLGMHGSLARLYFDRGDQQARAEVAWTLWVAIGASALLFAVMLDAIGPLLFGRLFREVPYSPYLRLAIWTACFSSLSLLPLGLLQIQERSVWYVAATAAAALTTAACVLFFTVVRGEGASGYLKGSLVAAIVVAGGYAVLMWRAAPFRLTRTIIPAALSYSLPLVPHGLAGWALGLSDRAILERYVSLDALGVYALAAQVAGVMTLAATAINTAWVPMLFRTDAGAGAAAEPQVARLVTYYVLALTWTATALILLLKPALRLLTSPAYHAAYPLVPWIVAGCLCNGLYFIPANFLFLRSKTSRLPIVTVTAGVVSISLNLLLVPRYGIAAAAWANCAAYLVMLVIAWIVARRVQPFPYEYHRIARVLMSGGALVAAGFLLGMRPGILDAGLRVALCMAFPALLHLTGFFTGAERARVVAASRALVWHARGGPAR
jgi:O-antigen/teichoic acid export membrane protein